MDIDAKHTDTSEELREELRCNGNKFWVLHVYTAYMSFVATILFEADGKFYLHEKIQGGWNLYEVSRDHAKGHLGSYTADLERKITLLTKEIEEINQLFPS